MTLDADIKKFIEKNIGFIEHEVYDELYESAYEWLSNEQCKELTTILEDTLNVTLRDIALSVAARHLEMELNNFANDVKAGTTMDLPSLIRQYMSHTCGIPYREFKEHMISNPPYNSRILIYLDSFGEPYFVRIG